MSALAHSTNWQAYIYIGTFYVQRRNDNTYLKAWKFDMFDFWRKVEEKWPINLSAGPCLYFSFEDIKWLGPSAEWGNAFFTWSDRRVTFWQFEHWEYVVNLASGYAQASVSQRFATYMHDVQGEGGTWISRWISKNDVLYRLDGASRLRSSAFIRPKFEDFGDGWKRRAVPTFDRRTRQADRWLVISIKVGWSCVHNFSNRKTRSSKRFSV